LGCLIGRLRRDLSQRRRKVNHSLLLLCGWHLAAPQHLDFWNEESRSIFISTIKNHFQELNLEYKETTMLLSLIRMIQAFRDYQRNVSELSQLSDRELADIGLDRSDIPRVAAGNYNG
jgi:uncharacterized protein YjiS (DUF1127 family)